jgi:hypothetical protein
VGREGGKALLDALLITDICIDFREYGKLRKITRGHVKTCLTH